MEDLTGTRTGALSLSQANPPEIKLYFMQTVSFVFVKNMAADNVIENQEYLGYTLMLDPKTVYTILGKKK